jgi:hypothetical protein
VKAVFVTRRLAFESGITRGRDVEHLQNWGITHVINLRHNIHGHLVGSLIDKASAKLANHRSPVLPPSLRLTTQGHCGSRQIARVKTYGEVVTEYECHPESKCADALASPCDRQTIGLLQRRHIKIDLVKCIGKESNSLESVDEGMVHSDQNVYTEYADPRRSEWIIKSLPALKKPELWVLEKSCGKLLSRRELIELRAGRSKPHRKTQELLQSILKGLDLL